MIFNSKKYVTKEELGSLVKTISDSVDRYNEQVATLVSKIQTLEVKLKKLYSRDSEIIQEIDSKAKIAVQQAKLNEEDNKNVIHIISKLSDMVNSLNDSHQQFKKQINKENLNSDEFNEKIKKLNEKLEVSVDILLDKITERAVEDRKLPTVFIEDKCPFKRKQGFCEIWAARKNKADALMFCNACLKSFELSQKGI